MIITIDGLYVFLRESWFFPIFFLLLDLVLGTVSQKRRNVFPLPLEHQTFKHHLLRLNCVVESVLDSIMFFSSFF